MPVWIRLNWRLYFSGAHFLFFFFLFFFSQLQLLTKSSVNNASVYYSWTHKLHFLATFLLKMGLMALFTYLKIILVQYFQFSVLTKYVLSKRTLIMMCQIFIICTNRCFLLPPSHFFFVLYSILRCPKILSCF